MNIFEYFYFDPDNSFGLAIGLFSLVELSVS